MREIKFRAKAISDDGWVYGMIHHNLSYILNPKYHNEYEDWVEVIPETIGQITGIQDRDGKDIYEGDIVECDWSINKPHNPAKQGAKTVKNEVQYQEVFYSSHIGGFAFAIDKILSEEKYKDISPLYAYRAATFLKVVGNIHENP